MKKRKLQVRFKHKYRASPQIDVKMGRGNPLARRELTDQNAASRSLWSNCGLQLDAQDAFVT